MGTETNQLPAQNRPLVTMTLVKALQEGDSWKIAGIASDETLDAEGDSILKKSLDLSYAQKRGFINWDHSRAPEDQVGYLTRCDVIDVGDIPQLEDVLETKLEKSASVYVEGKLYPYVDQAVKIQKIMKSVDGTVPALGLSLDGAVARVQDGGILRAFVRGVAITPAPAHPMTTVRLAKSLEDAGRELKTNPGAHDETLVLMVGEIVREELAKATSTGRMLSYDDAVLTVLKQRPRWNYELASKLVNYVMHQSGRSN